MNYYHFIFPLPFYDIDNNFEKCEKNKMIKYMSYLA